MTTRLDGHTIHLEGACPVAEAETLLARLQSDPYAAVDLSAATALHTALVQVLLAHRPARTGAPPADPFLARWIVPSLDAQASPMSSSPPGAPHAAHDPDRR